MSEFATAFGEKEYPPLLDDFLANTLRVLTDGVSEETFSQALIGAIERMTRLHDETLPEVSYITISMMYTEAYADRSRLRFDFYGNQWPIEELLYSEYVDLPWLFTYWQEHKDALREATQERRTWVRPVHLDAIALRSFQALGYLLAIQAKYWCEEVRASSALRKLRKQDEFYIFFGEYMDWRRPLCAVLPEIDIFHCDAATSLRFREFRQCRYREKKFFAIDLGAARFIDCRFENCTFEKTDLSDAIFKNCHFEGTVFTDALLPGTLFLHTAFKNVAFQRAFADRENAAYGKDDFYRRMEFGGCALEQVQLKDCRFAGALLTDCLAKDISADGGDFEDSDFAEFSHFPRQAGRL